jgi:hypothetical protein
MNGKNQDQQNVEMDQQNSGLIQQVLLSCQQPEPKVQQQNDVKPSQSHIDGLIQQILTHPHSIEDDIKVEKTSQNNDLIQQVLSNIKKPETQEQKKPQQNIEEPKATESTIGGLIGGLVLHPKFINQELQREPVNKEEPPKPKNNSQTALGGLIGGLVLQPKLLNEPEAKEKKKPQNMGTDQQNSGLIQQVLLSCKQPEPKVQQQNDVKPSQSHIDGLFQQILTHPHPIEEDIKVEKTSQNNDLIQQVLSSIKKPETQEQKKPQQNIEEPPKPLDKKRQNSENGHKSEFDGIIQQLLTNPHAVEQGEKQKNSKTINDLLTNNEHTTQNDHDNSIVSQLIASLETKNQMNEPKQTNKTKKSDSTRVSNKDNQKQQHQHQQSSYKSNLSKSEVNLRQSVDDENYPDDLGNSSVDRHKSNINPLSKAQSTTLSYNDRSSSALAHLSTDSNSNSTTLDRNHPNGI